MRDEFSYPRPDVLDLEAARLSEYAFYRLRVLSPDNRHLPADQQIVLVQEYQNGRLIRIGEDGKETEVLTPAAARARDQLVETSMVGAFGIAKEFAEYVIGNDKSFTIMDIVQEANSALIKAISTYQLDRGASFWTFAVKVIKHHLYSVIPDSNVRRTSEQVMRIHARLLGNSEETSGVSLDEAAKLYLIQKREEMKLKGYKSDREYEDKELEEDAKRLVKRITSYQKKAHVISLTQPFQTQSGDENLELIDSIPGEDPADNVDQLVLGNLWDIACKRLRDKGWSEQEISILALRVGFTPDGSASTFAQIEAITGVPTKLAQDTLLRARKTLAHVLRPLVYEEPLTPTRKASQQAVVEPTQKPPTKTVTQQTQDAGRKRLEYIAEHGVNGLSELEKTMLRIIIQTNGSATNEELAAALGIKVHKVKDIKQTINSYLRRAYVYNGTRQLVRQIAEMKLTPTEVVGILQLEEIQSAEQ
jgi:RNA polymerase sigma factor (sigma-70 family)